MPQNQMKIWIWSAVGLLVTNLVVVGIVAFLIHRDSVPHSDSQSLSGQKAMIDEERDFKLC
jgi:uncharacterized membrane-anchored protein YhcB (DUF1043 family)